MLCASPCRGVISGKVGVSHERFVKAGGSQDLQKASALEHDTLQPHNSTPATGQPPTAKILAPVSKAELKSGDAVGEDSFLEKMPFSSVLRCVEAGKLVVSILHSLGVYGKNATSASHLSHAICALLRKCKPYDILTLENWEQKIGSWSLNPITRVAPRLLADLHNVFAAKKG